MYNDDVVDYDVAKTVEDVVGGNVYWDYMTKAQGTRELGFAPLQAAGSESTYYCDKVTLRLTDDIRDRVSIATFGGRWRGDTSCGVFSLDVNSSVSLTDENVSARLSCFSIN